MDRNTAKTPTKLAIATHAQVAALVTTITTLPDWSASQAESLVRAYAEIAKVDQDNLVDRVSAILNEMIFG